MQKIKLRGGAWHGDSFYELDFPDEWQISHIRMPILDALTRNEMEEKINSPIGQKTLRDLALGRKNAIIVIDDLTRPTPVEIPLQIILNELINAGLPAGKIQILIAGGTHRPPTNEEIRRKIGFDLPAEIRVLSHNFHENLKYLGKTRNSTPIFINQALMDSDLKIGIGGLYPHPNAGFSGGAKIIAPAAAGLETIHFLHSNFQNARRRGDDLENEFRHECEDIARKVGLDFIVNLALNQDRKIAGIFAGDFVAAHREGATFAKEIYSVMPVENADIIITDAYPFDGELLFAHDRGFWPLRIGSEDAIKIIIAGCTDGVGSHELFPLRESFEKKLWRKFRHFRLRDLKKIPGRIISALSKNKSKPKDVKFILISHALSITDFQSSFPSGTLQSDWNAAKVELLSRLGARPLHVAIYQCAPLLIQKK